MLFCSWSSELASSSKKVKTFVFWSKSLCSYHILEVPVFLSFFLWVRHLTRTEIEKYFLFTSLFFILGLSRGTMMGDNVLMTIKPHINGYNVFIFHNDNNAYCFHYCSTNVCNNGMNNIETASQIKFMHYWTTMLNPLR